MAPRLSDKYWKFFKRFFCLSIPKIDLEVKKTTPNIEGCPESLGAKLKCWYIVRGLSHVAVCRPLKRADIFPLKNDDSNLNSIGDDVFLKIVNCRDSNTEMDFTPKCLYLHR